MYKETSMSYKLQVVCDDDFIEKLRVVAKSRGQNVASFVRWVVAEWLEKNQQKEVKQENE